MAGLAGFGKRVTRVTRGVGLQSENLADQLIRQKQHWVMSMLVLRAEMLVMRRLQWTCCTRGDMQNALWKADEHAGRERTCWS
eukprot:507802-Pelagomonas_calceolata.AAC.2